MIEDKEIWKDVPGYEGIYQASTEGRIKSFKGLNPEGKILSTNGTKSLYKGVALSKNKVSKQYSIHLLLAITFLNHTPNIYRVVDHINHNKHDNRLVNLRIIGRAQNIHRGILRAMNRTHPNPNY